MDNVKDITRIQDAAGDLQKVLKVKLEDGLQTMKAVQERVEEYNIHSNTFTNRVYEHLKNAIQTQVRVVTYLTSRSIFCC